MTRAQFLNDLYRRLSGLSQEQAEQHLTYYAEMLADRMEEGMSEEEAVASMEPLDVIVQRILQDEGVPEALPQPPQPPKYPDLPQTDGSRFTKVPPMPRGGIWKRLGYVLLWVVAIAMAISAVGRWMTRRHASADIAIAEEALPVDYGIAEEYANDWEEYAENWEEYADNWEEYVDGWSGWGDLLYSDLEDLWSLDVTPDGVYGRCFSLTPGFISVQDGVNDIQIGPDGVDMGSALDWGSLAPDGRYRYGDDIYRLDVGEAQSVSVKWNTGAVHVLGWEEEYIQFQEFSNTKLKQSQKLEYSVDGDMLNISKGASLDKGLTVWVPTRLLDYLCVETSTADIYCGQLLVAQGIVHATSGKIIVENSAFSTLSVEASSGSAALRCVAAETIGVDTTSGGVCLDAAVAENLSVSTSSGGISGLVVGGSVSMESSSGKITVNAAAGGLRLDSSSGAVTATLPSVVPMSYVGVDTTSGDVVLRVPEATEFALHFDSSAGYFDRGPFSVVRSEDMYVTGGGTPAVMLEVDTSSGSLRLGSV